MMLKDFHQRALGRFAFGDEAIGLEQARIILGQVHAAAPTEISPEVGTGDTSRKLNLGATITISSALSRKPVPLVITSATESP